MKMTKFEKFFVKMKTVLAMHHPCIHFRRHPHERI